MLIERYLKGSRLIDIKRSLNIISLQFKVADDVYCLHCSNLVRFLREDCIIASSNDIYICASDQGDENWDWSEHKNESVYDCIVSESVLPLLPDKVSNIIVTPWNDIEITFESGLLIEVIVTSVSGNEEWRFFKQGDSENNTLVAYGDGFERIGF